MGSKADICVIKKETRHHFDCFVPDKQVFDEPGTISMGAVLEGCPVGVCIIKIEGEDAAFLEWIYVDAPYRRQGIASAMLQQYTIYAAKKNRNYFSLCFDPVDKDAFLQEGAAFLEKMGFILAWRAGNYCISLDELKKNKRMSTFRIQREHVKSVEEYCELSRNRSEIKGFIRDRNVPTDIIDAPGVCEDASFVTFDRNKELSALLVSSRRGMGMGLDLIVSKGGAEADILLLLKSLYDYICDNEKIVNKLYFSVLNPKVENLIGYLFGKDVGKGWENVFGAMYIE